MPWEAGTGRRDQQHQLEAEKFPWEKDTPHDMTSSSSSSSSSSISSSISSSSSSSISSAGTEEREKLGLVPVPVLCEALVRVYQDGQRLVHPAHFDGDAMFTASADLRRTCPALPCPAALCTVPRAPCMPPCMAPSDPFQPRTHGGAHRDVRKTWPFANACWPTTK